jgi:hypothetical protein
MPSQPEINVTEVSGAELAPALRAAQRDYTQLHTDPRGRELLRICSRARPCSIV